MGTEGSKNDRKLDQQLLESYVSFPFLQSLDGKVVACTGATVGSLGYYVALTAIAKGARAIVLLNREGSRAIDAENSLKSFAQDMNESEKNGDEGTELCEIKTFYCELTSLFWVKSAVAGAQNFVKKFGGLDVLINCAGVAGLPDIRTTDGYDVQMQTNYLSHAFLTMLLMDVLDMAAESRSEARIVFITCPSRGIPKKMLRTKYLETSAPGELGGDNPWLVGDLVQRKGPFSRYQQSKLACSCFGMALHMKLKNAGSKVKVLVVDPGCVNTSLTSRAKKDGVMSDTFSNILKFISKEPAAGVVPILVASFGPNESCQSGDFFLPCDLSTGLPVKSVSAGVPLKKGAEKLSCHPVNLSNIWTATEKALNTDFENRGPDGKIRIGVRESPKVVKSTLGDTMTDVVLVPSPKGENDDSSTS